MLLKRSRYWESPGLWILVRFSSAWSYISYAKDWALPYMGVTASLTGQATGQPSPSGGQPVTALTSARLNLVFAATREATLIKYATCPLGPFLWPLLSTLTTPFISFPLPSNSLSPPTHSRGSTLGLKISLFDRWRNQTLVKWNDLPTVTLLISIVSGKRPVWVTPGLGHWVTFCSDTTTTYI